MSETQSINLGDMVRDRITGFSGVVVADTMWLNKCRRLAVQPRELDEKGRRQEQESFDVEQLELVEAAVVPVPEKQQTGGPHPEPLRAKDPTR